MALPSYGEQVKTAPIRSLTWVSDAKIAIFIFRYRPLGIIHFFIFSNSACASQLLSDLLQADDIAPRPPGQAQHRVVSPSRAPVKREAPIEIISDDDEELARLEVCR
jgi:hypothetical protein